NQVVLVSADGTGKRVNLTVSGFNNGNPQFGMDGKMMYWMNDKNGMKNLSRGSLSDVFGMFFDKAAWDKYNLSKDDLALKQEQDKRDTADKKKAEEKDKKAKGKDTAKAKVPPFVPDLKDVDVRTKRLTISAADIADAKLSNDGEKLFYLAKYEDGYNLWQTMPRTGETKVLAELKAPNGSLAMTKDGKSLFVLADGNIMKIGVDDGKPSPVHINGS